MDQEDETIAVLYNHCYGGWTLNPLVTELYNERKKAINPAFKPVTCMPDDYGSVVTRHDPLLVDIYYELGANFDGASYSQTNMETIPAKYKDYYDIQENDGYESVIINHEKYALHWLKEQIRILLENTVTTDAEKMKAVRQLL